MKFLKGLVIICLLVLQACQYKNSKEGEVSPGQGNAGQGDAVNDFAFVKKEVIEPRCLECHSSSGTLIVLETYAQVFVKRAAIRNAVLTDSMPKNRSPLTANQKQILISWIDAGAPETIVAKPEPPPSLPPPADPLPEPDPVEPAKDWLTVRTLVLEPACFRCHSAPTNRAGVNVETYQNVIANLNRIEQAIQDGSMPLRGSLSAEQKKLILDWIQDGAPEFARP